jgi:signal transduction histidine kinase
MESQVEPQAVVDGTTLAQPRAVSAPDAVWRTQRDQFFVNEARRTTRTITAFGIGVQLAIIGLLVQADYPTWRIIGLAGVYVGFVLGHRIVITRTRSQARVEHAFIAMNIIAQLLVIGSCAMTGGVHSPLLPAVVMPSIVSLLFFGPHAVARWTAVANGLFIIAMVSLPHDLVGPQLPSANYAIAAILGLGWNLVLLHMMVGKLTKIAHQSGESYACLREERLSEAEAQLRRLQSVGAKVAHELKNPLAAIKGLCQLVARTPNSERTQERLTVVASEISRMETILNEYLSFSRPLEDLKPETVDFAALSRDVMNVLAGRADQAGVTLSLEGGATRAQGDPRRLKEALINLVANAIEATPNGGLVKLRVHNGGDDVVVEVADTGRGIAPDDLKRLGTSFFTTRPNGTGLGVVLAQGVITQHGGSLAYTSTIGRGTTATITLPTSASASPELGGRAAMVEARA